MNRQSIHRLRGRTMTKLQAVPPSRQRDAGKKYGPAQRLENLWRQGLRPDLRAFLAKEEALTPAQLVAVLLVDQEQRWRAGEQIPAETYLEMNPVLFSAWSEAFELVEAEFRLRQEQGESPTMAAFSARFPQYAAKLQRLDPALDGSSAPHTANIHTPGGDV